MSVNAKGLFPSQAARLVMVGFQGESKKALVELAPLRWRADTGQLFLARRLVVRLHLLMCRPCRHYAAQIRSLGEAARRLFGQTTDSASLEDLKARILSQAPKTQGKENGVT